MVKILVFDTETTNLPPLLPGETWNERSEYGKKLLDANHIEQWKEVLHAWPHIIQFSYIFYDTEVPKDAKIFNKYIDITHDNNIVISEGSIAIHHITKEKIAGMSPNEKTSIQETLHEFMGDFKNADIVVGHNVEFDRKMVVAELLRIYQDDASVSMIMDDRKFACTMIDTTEICKLQIKIDYKDKKTGELKYFYKIKSPKLTEAYKHYFGYEPNPEALHDAIADVVLCLRIFVKYKYDKDVCGTNPKITHRIIKLSPQGYSCPALEGKLVEQDMEVEGGGAQEEPMKLKRRKRSKAKSKSQKVSKKRTDYFSWKSKSQKSKKNKTI
jgi:DNA polymerase III subunit epsilon